MYPADTFVNVTEAVFEVVADPIEAWKSMKVLAIWLLEELVPTSTTVASESSSSAPSPLVPDVIVVSVMPSASLTRSR